MATPTRNARQETSDEGPLPGCANGCGNCAASRSRRKASARGADRGCSSRRGRAEQPIDPHESGQPARQHPEAADLTAYDVMVPRVDIMALDIETPFAEAAKQCVEHGHSRLPVYRETLDDIVGIDSHQGSCCPSSVDGRRSAAGRASRASRSSSRRRCALLDLLLQMRLARTHLALVVDEFGGTDGLVTIEDLVEQIVGEIEDEHDVADGPKLVGAARRHLDSRTARTPIEDARGHVDGAIVTEEREDDITRSAASSSRSPDRVPGARRDRDASAPASPSRCSTPIRGG